MACFAYPLLCVETEIHKQLLERTEAIHQATRDTHGEWSKVNKIARC